MFENRLKNTDNYASRFIASWVREGGKLRTGKDYDDFREWLTSLDLNEEDVNHIYFLASNGKLELEISAKKFLANLNE